MFLVAGLHTSQEEFWPTPLYRNSLNPLGCLAAAWQRDT